MVSKVAQVVTIAVLSILGIALIVFAIYGQYQASQLYPAIHQQIGFQACVAQVQQEQAKTENPEVTK